MRLGKAFSVVAYDSELGCGDAEEAARKSDKLKMFIREYFTEVERSVPDTMPAAETCQHQVGELLLDDRVGQFFKLGTRKLGMFAMGVRYCVLDLSITFQT